MEFTTTQRGGQLLLFEGHRYQINRKGKDERIFWRCHYRVCPGRVTTEGGNILSSKPHDHPADEIDNKVEKIKADLKKAARDKTAPIPELFNSALSQIALEEDARDVAVFMPTYSSFRSSMYRSRLKTHPPLPTVRADIELEGDWTKTKDGQRFLLRSDGDQDKILIFATDIMLQRLATAETLYMDGTFSVCPRVFYQLFTVNIILSGQQFPAVYALLPNKSRETYNRVFTLIKEELQNINIILRPPRILIDFEQALLQSVNLHFPDTDVKGCFFHFSQCLWRWVQNHGHVVLYKENEEFRILVKHAAALAYLPPAMVRLAWSTIRLNYSDGSAAAEAFVDYFSNTWTKDFPIALWNHFEATEDRTNNRLEGWHNRLNRLAGRNHPNIYQLIELLQKEDSVSEVKILQLQSGGLPVRRRNKWQRMDKRLKRMQAKFTSGQLSIAEFMEAVSLICGL